MRWSSLCSFIPHINYYPPLSAKVHQDYISSAYKTILLRQYDIIDNHYEVFDLHISRFIEYIRFTYYYYGKCYMNTATGVNFVVLGIGNKKRGKRFFSKVL